MWHDRTLAHRDARHRRGHQRNPPNADRARTDRSRGVSWLYLSALAMAATAVIHSVAGEKRLIGPLLNSDATRMLGPQLSGIMRGAWHLTSLFMVLFGVVVAWPGMPAGDRKSVGEGKSVSVRVDLGGGRIIKKKR